MIKHYILSIALILSISSCDKFKPVPDPQEVIDVPGFDGGAIYVKKINDENEIIGFYGSLYPNGSSLALDEGGTSTGFKINSNGNGYVDLTQAGQIAVFPMSINNSSVIVGEFVPENPVSSNFMPGHAFRVNSNGTGYKSLHPSGAFRSSATHITDNGIIVGMYTEDELGSTACIFRGDSVAALLDTSVWHYSEVHAVNEKFAVIYAFNGTQRQYFRYQFDNESMVQLSISPKVADFSEIHDLNENDVAVGFYVDLSISDRAIGLKYDLNTLTLAAYQAENNQDGFKYLEYNFFAINDNDLIVGWSGRDFIDEGFLQNRAFKISSSFSGFRDVTPQNKDIYSELNALNNNGLAVGVVGLPRKNSGVENKIMVLDLSNR